VKVSELVNVSELSGGEQKVSGPKIRKYGQGHFLGCRRVLLVVRIFVRESTYCTYTACLSEVQNNCGVITMPNAITVCVNAAAGIGWTVGHTTSYHWILFACNNYEQQQTQLTANNATTVINQSQAASTNLHFCCVCPRPLRH
jgi:hypothetical protein